MARVYKYWGKFQELTGEYHLAVYHALDVYLCGKEILRMKGWKSRCAPTLAERNYLLFALASHDIGKLSALFGMKKPAVVAGIYPPVQAKMLTGIQESILRAASEIYYHNSYGYYFAEQEGYYGLPKEADEWFRGAVGGHHGVPCIREDIIPSATPQSINPIRAGLYRPEIKQFLEYDVKARCEFMEWLISRCLSKRTLRRKPPKMSIEAMGLVSLCDWLASNPCYFPLVSQEMDLDEYIKMRRPLAKKAVREACIGGHDIISSSWEDLFPHLVPNELQRLVMTMRLPKGPCMIIIEGSTGIGKTEIALMASARINHRNGYGGIIFAEPLTSATNDMYRRLAKIAPAIYGKEANVSLNHSRRHTNPLWSSNAGTVFGVDEKGEPMSGCASWIADKRNRFALADVSVCTIDQLALSVLPVHHRPVRILSMSRSTLVIDEVHCYSPYLLELTKEAIRNTQKHGGSVILLSATLPQSIKEDLVDAFYAHGANRVIHVRDRRYPLITVVENNKARTLTTPTREKPKRIRVRVSYRGFMIPSDDHLREVVRRAASGQKVGIITNLVGDAQDIYERILKILDDCGLPHTLVHSRFIVMHRTKKDAMVSTMARRGLPYGVGCITVATQVIEHSLDLDFDYMITQLCPLDRLFQRFGRLWRMIIEERIKSLGTVAECLVLMPLDINRVESYGKHALVYHELDVMWRTARILDPTGDGSGRHYPMRFPAAYRVYFDRVYDKRTKIGGVPDELEARARSQDNSEMMRALANSRTEMTARDVIINDKNYEEVMTRPEIWTKEVHLVLPRRRGEDYHRTIETEVPLIDPAMQNKTVQNSMAKGIPMPGLTHSLRRGHDEFLKNLESVTVSIPDHWHEDLVTRWRQDLSYVVVRPIGNGCYRVSGIKHSYIYSWEYGFRREA